MRPKFVLILALGLAGAVGSGMAVQPALAALADSTLAAPDSAAAMPDTTAAQPDSVATTPVVPAAAPVVPATTTTTPAAPPPTQTPAPASTPPPTTAAPAKAEQSEPQRVYYGGTVTFSFGSTTRIGVYPMIGYRLTPKISGGVEAGYEYVTYNNQSTNNYGGSVFARFHARRNMYAHAEYQTINYEVFGPGNSSRREWVPFLLLGGGVIKPLGKNMSAYAEVLFDVLQDDKSPYGNWEPVVNVGVGVGF